MANFGYKQTPEHIAAKSRFGDAHHGWKGENITRRSGRSRALRLYPTIGPCVLCGDPKSERHHMDDDTTNNTPENILPLCRKCHMSSDGRLAKVKEVGRNRIKKLIEQAAAKRRSQTLCKRGHELSGDNLANARSNGRICKQCQEIRRVKYLKRKADGMIGK